MGLSLYAKNLTLKNSAATGQWLASSIVVGLLYTCDLM
jgi:hypothetical protein